MVLGVFLFLYISATFDLQSRRISGVPANGLYINHEKKVMK